MTRAELIQNEFRNHMQSKVFIKQEPKDEPDEEIEDDYNSADTEKNTDDENFKKNFANFDPMTSMSAHFDWNKPKQVKCMNIYV